MNAFVSPGQVQGGYHNQPDADSRDHIIQNIYDDGNIKSFIMAELKEGQEPGVTEAGVTEETVVYFSPGAEGFNMEEVAGVTIQDIGLEMEVGKEGQVLSLVQINDNIPKL